MADAAATTKEPKEPKIVSLRDGGIVKKILRDGTGDATPKDGADVEVHYTGRLLDGTKFDSSRDRNELFSFKIGRGQVIKAWDEGVATMKKGELALLTCKPEFAYGARGAPPSIPPNATLEFEVELFGWTKTQKVTDDRKVMKEVLKDGVDWNRPNDGATVTVKYTGRVADGGAVFANHASDAVTLVVGTDLALTEGFEESVKNMLKGERSLFTVDASYGYGAKGNADLKVPGGAALEYDIELLSFEKGKESFEMSADEKLALGERKKGSGNALYARGDLQRASKHYNAALALFKFEKQYADAGASFESKMKALKVTLCSNLAAVKHKAGDEKATEDACNDALAIDPKHVKSLYRRASVYAHRNDYARALKDLSVAKEVDSKNADVNKLYTAVEARVTAEKQKERDMWRGAFGKVALVSDAELAKLKKDKEEAVRKAKQENGDDSDEDDSAPTAAPAAASAGAATAKDTTSA